MPQDATSHDGSEIRFKPPGFTEFLAIEEQNLVTTLVKCREEFDLFSRLNGLYHAALTDRQCDEENAVVLQLAFLIHYHLYFSNLCMMRCHLSEAFASVRVAIDASLIASQIIHDRASQLAYMNRTKPFDKLIRHFKNLIKDGKPLPNKHVPHLIQRLDFCSQYASHADIDAFAHRADVVGEAPPILSVQYFQYSRDLNEFRLHMLAILHDFVVSLDVFADWFVDEMKALPADWRETLRRLGATIERRQKALAGGQDKPTEASGKDQSPE